MRILPIIAGLAGILALAPASSRATLVLQPVEIDISPLSGAANVGTNVYMRDYGVGLSGLNEPGMFTMAGSGNELGSGITFDETSKILTFDFAYGSAFGFDDLTGDFNAVHFHAPGLVNHPTAPNTNGGVIQNLGSFHTATGAKSGRITGNITLDATNEARLFENEIYINIHSTVQTGGEIRGQLIVIPEPGTAILAVFASPLFLRRRRRN